MDRRDELGTTRGCAWRRVKRAQFELNDSIAQFEDAERDYNEYMAELELNNG